MRKKEGKEDQRMAKKMKIVKNQKGRVKGMK